ncbi:MAG: outer membrane lipoprotein-sorting protein [Alphaproteobacteria bacterium]|nr:MAG: outer membrane lipoprotein-sorting protein [Alphaproteobacteria bacterium]
MNTTYLKRFTLTLYVVGSFLGTMTAVKAETMEEKGFAISARADRSDLGFGDSVSDMKMILKNAHGQETNRIMKNKILEVQDESVGDKSITVFTSPSDISGTALLSHAKILAPDDQWLYLPALKRIKRISSVNKSGPFVGSEFAFEDFTSLELGKYDYKFLRTEKCGGLTCDVVERYPRYKHSGYTKQISWIDQDVFQARKIEFYDRRGGLLKTLTFSGYKKHAGKYWRAHKLHMENAQNGKRTDLIYSNYKFNTGLNSNDFEKGVLTRVR